MKKIAVIMKRDLRETFRTRSFYVNIGVVALVMVILGWGMGGEMGTLVEEAEVSVIQALLGALAFMLSLMLMMLFSLYINAYSLILEKVKRSIESLLCTPLSLRQIWLGKSLALFLPSLVLSWIFTFGVIAGMNWFFIVPDLGQFIMPGAAPLVAILVVVPFIFFFLSAFVVALQLVITNIRMVNSILAFVIVGIPFGLSSVLTRFGPESWNVVLISLGIAALLALVAFLFFPHVTRERIVLSSKG